MDNTERIVGLASFVGGESQDVKYGSKYQYDYGRNIDVRKKPTQFSVLPGTVKTSGGVVTDLVQDMCQVPSGVRYGVGDSGNIYKVTAAGVWSKIGALGENGGGGIIYRSDTDMVYITGQTKIARIKNISTTPVPEVNWFQYGVSTATSCTKTGGTSTYIPKTAINETATDMRTFIADIEPLYRIGVVIPSKGTGDWTLTLHDDANNSLGAVTIANANVTPGQKNYFTFSSPLRIQVSINNYTSTSTGGRTYHYHLTTTVADGAVTTTTSGSLADCDMELWASALASTTNGLHPISQFANLLLIGNGKYVASYEPLQDSPTTSDFFRHRLQFPPGYEVNGLAQLELYAAITAEKRSTSTSQDFQEGKMFLWDAVATTYNRYYDIPEGSPEGLFSHKNVVRYVADGALYASSGGQPVKERTFRNTDSEFSSIADSTHVYPHMMTVRRGVLLVGYPSITTNRALEHAVYGWGQISSQYPMSWTTSYTISSGTVLNTGSNNLRIGMVKNFGDTLYISWQEGSSYGVDIVNNSSTPASSFQVQALYYDGDGRNPSVPYKQKLAKKAFAVFDDLPAGVSLRMWYKIDGESTKHYMTDDSTDAVTTGKIVTLNISKQYVGVQIGLEGTITGTTSPVCKGLFLVVDPQAGRGELS
jgi:hypothetical protein